MARALQSVFRHLNQNSDLDLLRRHTEDLPRRPTAVTQTMFERTSTAQAMYERTSTVGFGVADFLDHEIATTHRNLPRQDSGDFRLPPISSPQCGDPRGVADLADAMRIRITELENIAITLAHLDRLCRLAFRSGSALELADWRALRRDILDLASPDLSVAQKLQTVLAMRNSYAAFHVGNQ